MCLDCLSFFYTFHVKDTVESGNVIWHCIDLFTTESSEVHLTAFYFADNRLYLMIDYSKKKLYDLSGSSFHSTIGKCFADNCSRFQNNSLIILAAFC